MVRFLAHPGAVFWPAGPTDRHAEDASGLLVIASRPKVGVGQFGAHDWITPVGLLRALGVDGLGLDQAMGCPCLTHSFRRGVGTHGTLPTTRVEAAEGRKEGVAANVGPEALDVALAAQSLEGGRDRLEAALGVVIAKLGCGGSLEGLCGGLCAHRPCPTCPSCGSSFQSSRSAVWVTLHSPVRAHAREVPGAMMYLVELFPAGTTWPSGSLGHAAAVFATTATDRVRSTGDRLEQEAMSFK